MKNLICSTLALLFILCSDLVYSQSKASSEVSIRGFNAASADLPFWMQHNTRGRILGNTNFLALARGKLVHQFGFKTFLEAGGGVFFGDQQEKVRLDELYLSFRNSWVEMVVGKKQRPELYRGLSATNESILRSINARPIPGVALRSARPIFVLPKARFGFEFSWEESQLEGSRHVSDARLHHKSFHVVYEPVQNVQLKAGLQHYVQWGGISASHGDQPESFHDYLRILAGRNGGETAVKGDQTNALGNNIGSYEIFLHSRLGQYNFSLLYNTIFEDGSGMRLGNTPDGRYGLFVEDSQKEWWLQAFMYEFYYTKHQSHTTTGPHKFDNYFFNGVYRSGWSYYGRILGTPFFLPNENGIGLDNNIFTAHHFGISGLLAEKLPFRFLTSYRRNYGSSHTTIYRSELYAETQEIFSSLFELQIPLRHMQFKLQLGSDFANDAGPNFGAGIEVNYGL